MPDDALARAREVVLILEDCHLTPDCPCDGKFCSERVITDALRAYGDARERAGARAGER